MPSGRLLKALSYGLEGVGTPASRAEARRKKAESDAALEKLQLKRESGIDEQEIQIIKNQNEKLLSEMARTKTFEAFRAYNSDQDPRHLNTALKDPILKDLFSHVTAVDKINPTSDQELIKRHGLDPELFTDPELSKNALSRFVKVIQNDGTMVISDIVQLQAATGYTRHMTNQQLEDLKTRSIITKNLKTGSGTETAAGKDSEKWGPILEKLKEGKALDTKELAFHKLMIDKTQGNVAGQLDAVEETTATLLSEVGGDEGWQKLDLQKRKNRLKVRPFIERIEKLGGLELSADERKIINNVNKLLTLGSPAANLTAEETGLMDNLWFRMKKYVPGQITNDDLRAVKAAAGYAAFQNELRKVLYGSVLTPGEIEKFNSAYGTLKQQFPEVMAQFGTMLKGLQSDIESLMNLNNPYVIEYRLGDTPDRVNTLVENVESILNNLVTEVPEVIEQSTKKKSLKEIFRQ